MATRILLFIFVSLVGSLLCHAQDASVIPGELKLLQGPINDTDRARTYNWICFNYAYENPAEGIDFGRLGLELSKKLDFKKGIGDAHSNMGFCFTCQSQFDSARVHYEKATEAFRKAGNNCWVKVPLSNLGANYFKQKDLVNALEKYLQAAKLEEGCEDRGFKSTSIYSVGIVYNAMDKYELAIPYFEQAYAIDVANKDSSKMAERLAAMGNAYTGMQQYEKARQKFNEALRTYSDDDSYRKALAHYGLAKLEEKTGNRSSAIGEAELARAVFREEERTSDWLGACVILGELYSLNGNWQKAKEVLNEGVRIAEELKVQDDRLKIYSRLALVSMKTGANENAAKYFDKYLALRDSMETQELNDKLADYSTKYETEKKEKDLAIEREKNLSQELEIKDQQFQKRVFLGLGAIFLLLALILINRYRLKQRIAKELEEKNVLIEKEKNRAEESERFKQQFLANMSHEMRTPVSVISGLANLLREKQLDESSKKYVEAIHHSSDNLVSLVNDVLDLAKMEEGKMTLRKESFSLHKELNLLVESFLPQTKRKNISLQLQVDENVHDNFMGDVRRLKQILYNLISNAIKFTDKGSVDVKVGLATSRLEQTPKGRTSPSGVTRTPEAFHAPSGFGESTPRISISVQDSGIGIPPEQLHRIFENYVQTGSKDRGGTGLGLGIARQLAELMGGTVSATSTPNLGSTFTLSVPLEHDVEGNKSHRSLNTQFKTELKKIMGNKPVLVVDDYAYNRMLASETLRSWFSGIAVHEVENGSDAIAKIENNDYAFVLMDLRMSGMNGIECTREVRTFSDVPIIALTASAMSKDRDDCLAAGMQEVVPKPFTEMDLLSAIALVLHRKITDKDYSEATTSTSLWPYLHELCEGDETKIKKYLRIALEELPKLLTDVRNAIASSDSSLLKISIHRSISYLVCFEMKQETAQAQNFDKLPVSELTRQITEVNKWLTDIDSELNRIQNDEII